MQVMPSNLYSLPLTVTIPAGETLVRVPVTVTSTNTLSSTATYGIGITISSVDGGLLIAENQKNLLIEIAIKNKWDGRYRLRGYHNRPGLSAPYNEEVYMITSGANSVNMWWPALGAFAHPLNGGATYYGSFTHNYYFNSSDVITAWDWTPYATTLPVAVGPGSRYDPATKIIYFYGWYNNNPGARAFFDTLTYLGPRP